MIILDIKKVTCCFTGHRHIPLAKKHIIQEQLEVEIKKLIQIGVVHFCTGGALGFDTIAALAILKLKQTYPQIKFILILPCYEQADNWNYPDRVLYYKILHKADEIRYTSEQYTQHCMHIRNRYLVNYSGYCICYLTQNYGGTAYTVEYAKKQELKIINLANCFSAEKSLRK